MHILIIKIMQICYTVFTDNSIACLYSLAILVKYVFSSMCSVEQSSTVKIKDVVEFVSLFTSSC